MARSLSRRLLLGSSLAALPFARLAQAIPAGMKISLAQWSLHKAIQSRQMTNLEFPRIAREQFGIEGLEFVNTLWMSPTQSYLAQLKKNMNDTGTKAVLIMVDGEGMMGHSKKEERLKAAASHHKWVDYAAELGAHSIRTNMYPDDKPTSEAEITEFLKRCQESFNALCEYARPRNINVIIENHGGLSSQPEVLLRLMKMVEAKNFGVLPDFGNFYGTVDRYDAVKQMMPYAKGVSFKCYDFDAQTGKETKLDMDRLMKTVAEAGYKGYVGIEYEGSRLSEFEGIQAAKRYLDRVMV